MIHHPFFDFCRNQTPRPVFGSEQVTAFLRLLRIGSNMAQSGAQQKRESVIDENLKRVYEEALEEAVPDRFKDLLAALKEQEQGKGPSE
ncbi:NepR family anti-sigma factor [uncultured Roseobacter sp.]|uniref:NepR family anti-sigma factor n=1 Tax=uncultured Roseobacter sp. TaxID=114847 RepID=UPI003452C363